MKLSTKILALLSLGVTSFFMWLLDPTNFAAVNTLLHGHAKLLMGLNFAVQLWNLSHQPSGTNPGAANK